MADMCNLCGGTGRLYALNSHFTNDGYYSFRCNFCHGGGYSNHRGDIEYRDFQKTARDRIKEWHGMKPKAA